MKKITLMHVSGTPIQSRWTDYDSISVSSFNFLFADEIDTNQMYFRYGEKWYHEDELCVISDENIREVI